MDDTQAIRRLKRGDLGGLEILMEQYQVKAARAAFLITNDESIAQDVVQETFIRICQKIHQFDESRPFEPYLIRSVIHAALNAVRGSSKFTSLDDEAGEIKNLLDRAASVESQVESTQLQHEILNALSKLSPRQRAVIVQRYYLEMSEQEMALALDAAPGTVKWLLNAARERLRHLLGQKGESNE
ncbi:sigma-70 family RNA polymerase sigma factor [Chloroflexota bacterium]